MRRATCLPATRPVILGAVTERGTSFAGGECACQGRQSTKASWSKLRVSQTQQLCFETRLGTGRR
jgi:hypothetical protein